MKDLNPQVDIFDKIVKKKNVSDVLRILVPLYMTYVLFLISVFFFFIPRQESQLMDQKKKAIIQLTDSAISLLTEYENRIQEGKISPERARKEAAELIRHLRYGIDGKNYFWINDFHPFMVMHPYCPDLEGSDLTLFKDAEGYHPFMTMVEEVKSRGNGFLNYHWQWKDMPEVVIPKLSYVKGFSAWSWIIGTGIYEKEIKREIALSIRTFLYIFVGILIFIVLLSLYITRRVFIMGQKRSAAEQAWKKEELRKSRADVQLRESEARYKILADNATDVIWIIDLKSMKFTYVSPAMDNLLGYRSEEIIGTSMGMRASSASLKKALSMISKELDQDLEADPNRCQTIELDMIKKDGTTINTEITARFLRDERGKPDRILGITRDITEYRQMEARSRQIQKMEALGTLAGGIAHDFNNILSSMIGFTELAKRRAKERPDIQKQLEHVIAGGLRARDLVKHILLFSRKADVQKAPIKISHLIKECLKFLEASLSPNIEISRNIIYEERTILADPTQMHQVLMNLFTNAAHAMKDNGGVLNVKLDSVNIDWGDMERADELEPGCYMRIIVTDTGCGIPKEILPKILEPFFTTKPRGEGTGMGLSTAYGIIREMKGSISAYSEPGMGATFQILIPALENEISEKNDSENLLTGGHSGRILLVDDEAGILKWTSQALGYFGYDVVTAKDGLKALDRFTQDQAGFDLILTDLVMPGLSGLELAQKIRQKDPDLPIVICTGFSERVTREEINACSISDLVMKPMIPGELAQVISRLLIKKGKMTNAQNTDN